ncbi:MAG: hypothetical protein PVG14_07685 [Anaerolineales bacterium]
MKRKSLLLIPILTFSALILVLIIMELRSPPTWQTTLNNYLTYLNSYAKEPATLESVTKASKPWNFSSQMRSITYSDSLIFQTINFSQKPDEQFITFAILTVEPPKDQRKPLPFPPKEIWCVRLNLGNASRVVFLALHEDLYNADMVVHEVPKEIGQQSLLKTLTKIGCD